MSEFNNYGPIADYDYQGPTITIKTRYGETKMPTEAHAIGMQDVFGIPMLQVYIPLMFVEKCGSPLKTLD